MVVRCARPVSAVTLAMLVGTAAEVACAALPAFTSAVALRHPAPESGVYIGGTDPASAGSGAAGYTVIGGAWRAARWSTDGSGIPLGHVPGQSTITSYAHGINA